jgi:hypothetical protein
MELKEIIEIASSVYPEGLVIQAYEANGNVGDGLAEFIVRELKDTYDSQASDMEQLEEAERVMKNAQKELENVVSAFFNRQEQWKMWHLKRT